MARYCANNDPPTEVPNKAPAPANDNGFNPDDYLADLEAFDLSEAQKRELLQTLWNIMCAFVDIGWGVDTVQHIFPELFAVDNFNKAGSQPIQPHGSVGEQNKNKDV